MRRGTNEVITNKHGYDSQQKEENMNNQIEMLEQELKMMLENIERVKEFSNDKENKHWKPYTSRVFGELKHRGVSIKQRITLVSKLSTRHLFEINTK